MSEQTFPKDCPRCWKGRAFSGQGYDTYGRQRDGKYYVRLEVATALEQELNAANMELEKLKKKLTKLIK